MKSILRNADEDHSIKIQYCVFQHAMLLEGTNMAYRHDQDLEFMDRAKHDDFQNLVFVLTHDPKDGKTRWTEELRSKLKGCNDYHYRWQDIAGELQCFGGDTIANLTRLGKGVLYRELLCDVCDAQKLQYDKKAINIADIENKLVESCLTKMWGSWDSNSRAYMLAIASIFVPSFKKSHTPFPSAILSSTLPSIFTSGILHGGIRAWAITQMTTGLVTTSLTGLSAIAASTLGMSAFSILAPRLVALAIPATAILEILSTALVFSGPAYRVTLPACLAVAELRKQVALSPREILRMRRLEEIIRILQKALIKAGEKAISLYVFAFQVMKNFQIDEEETFKALIFGMANINQINDDELEKRKNNTSLAESIASAKKAGCTREELAAAVMVVGQLGELTESYMNTFIDLNL